MTMEPKCPNCGSTNVIKTDDHGICRDCWTRDNIDEFYLTPIERLYKREGNKMFDKLLNQ